MSSSCGVDPSLTQRVWEGHARGTGPKRSNARDVCAAVALTIALVAAAFSLYRSIRDPRMGAGAAGRALTTRVHNGGVYRCHHIENDGTIVGMHDVDYVCDAVNEPILPGYVLGTDRNSITEIQANG